MTHRKPHRTSFLLRAIFFPIGTLFTLAAGGSAVATFFGYHWAMAAAGGVWALLAAWITVHGLARFRKEQYEVHADRIVIRRGSLISDEEVEVHYAKITHVKWIRPWLWHRLFGVGDVHVEVAGSGTGTISFIGIRESDAAVAELRGHMGQAFSMSTARCLHEERPARLGILLDLVLKGGWGFLLLMFAFGREFVPVLLNVASVSDEGVDVVGFAEQYGAWLLLLIPLALGAIGLLVLRYLDLKHRTYRVYDGLIEYQEGFLTRNDAFMPVENLSNSEVTRGIAERVTGLYNVVVSCQGAGQQVAFLYLRNGPALNAVLDGLIEASSTPREDLPAPVTPDPVGNGETPHPDVEPLPAADIPVTPDAVYRMHVGRTLVPMVLYIFLLPLLLLAFPILVLLLYRMGMQVARMIRTTYTLRRNSVEEKLDLVSVRTREFSKDKLTGVVLRTNLWDRLFGTVTIQFWSIGAGREIVFRNVKRSDELLSGVFQRAGMRFDEWTRTIESDFSPGRFILANLPGLFFTLVAMGGAAWAMQAAHPAYGLLIPVVGLLPVAGLLRGLVYYPRCRLLMYRQGLVFQRGVLVYLETYARYENVKDTTTVKIPGFDAGAMRFNVAGERLQEGNGRAGIPYGFTMHYVPDILRKDDFFDHEVLARRPEPTTTEIAAVEARRALPNTAVRVSLTCIILFPLIPLLPLLLPWHLWRTSLFRYRIEPERVLMRRGRLYRIQTSILFDRIDHIQISQGALNKLFGNGNIVISTAGSTRPELVLRDVKEYRTFYETLRERNR